MEITSFLGFVLARITEDRIIHRADDNLHKGKNINPQFTFLSEVFHKVYKHTNIFIETAFV